MNCRFCEQPLLPTQNRCPRCGRFADVPQGDHTFRFSKKDRDNRHLMAALSYLNILVLIPILFARRSQYVRYHANQGLVLFLFWSAYTLATRLFVLFLDLLFGGIYAAIPATLSSIFSFVSIIFFILAILGISNAVKGRAKDLPVIGRIRFLF